MYVFQYPWALALILHQTVSVQSCDQRPGLCFTVLSAYTSTKGEIKGRNIRYDYCTRLMKSCTLYSEHWYILSVTPAYLCWSEPISSVLLHRSPEAACTLWNGATVSSSILTIIQCHVTDHDTNATCQCCKQAIVPSIILVLIELNHSPLAHKWRSGIKHSEGLSNLACKGQGITSIVYKETELTR